MNHPKGTFLADLAIGLVAGLVATKVTALAEQALSKPMPASIKRREAQVRPGPSAKVAARKTADTLGYALDEQRIKPAARALHYGLGMAWGPIYSLLRRHSRMEPLGAGLVTGAALSLIVDEALTPALGFSAPSRDYPTATHLRGFAGHLVYGAAAALTAEAIYRLTDTTPDRDGAVTASST
jgi:uncharacterized membrane protein YagU involved in acid resistance